MVKELEADTATETRFSDTAGAAASIEQCRVAVFACASCCSQNIEEWANSLFPLVPENFTCFFRS